MYGLNGPKEVESVPAVYDQAFARFQPLIALGKRKSVGAFKNSATNATELIQHAALVKPEFIALLEKFTSTQQLLQQCPDIRFSSGLENEHIVKFGESLDFKLRYKPAPELIDMVRSTVICPSIKTLHDTMVNILEYCRESGTDYRLFSFYDSVERFGSADRVDKDSLFGYVGLHVTLLFSVEQPPVEGGTTGYVAVATGTTTAEMKSDGADASAVSAGESSSSSDKITLMAEIQFHPSTIYDGTRTCLKEQMHEVYKAFIRRTAQQKDPETVKLARAAVQMNYAYAMAITPE